MTARALVLDDSRATRMMLRRILGQLGFEDVAEAEHGIQGLQQLGANEAIELVLVDWNMPEMDGLTFVKEVRADTRYADVRLVMVTTESEIENMIRALDAGADEYVMKPFTPGALREKLELLGMGGADAP